LLYVIPCIFLHLDPLLFLSRSTLFLSLIDCIALHPLHIITFNHFWFYAYMAVLLVFLALPNILIWTSTSLALLAPRVLFLRVNTSVFYPPS
jgi:hypothetical protein